MNPAHKAQDLINLFTPFAKAYDLQNHIYNTKQCALVTINEILSLAYSIKEFTEAEVININYWQEVKSEIEKL